QCIDPESVIITNWQNSSTGNNLGGNTTTTSSGSNGTSSSEDPLTNPNLIIRPPYQFARQSIFTQELESFSPGEFYEGQSFRKKSCDTNLGDIFSNGKSSSCTYCLSDLENFNTPGIDYCVKISTKWDKWQLIGSYQIEDSIQGYLFSLNKMYQGMAGLDSLTPKRNTTKSGETTSPYDDVESKGNFIFLVPKMPEQLISEIKQVAFTKEKILQSLKINNFPNLTQSHQENFLQKNQSNYNDLPRSDLENLKINNERQARALEIERTEISLYQKNIQAHLSQLVQTWYNSFNQGILQFPFQIIEDAKKTCEEKKNE
nr:hypothetical protein [Candidatus Gracilibacteria bacterium]